MYWQDFLGFSPFFKSWVIFHAYKPTIDQIIFTKILNLIGFKNDSIRVTAIRKISDAKEAISILRNLEVAKRLVFSLKFRKLILSNY